MQHITSTLPEWAKEAEVHACSTLPAKYQRWRRRLRYLRAAQISGRGSYGAGAC